MKNLLNIEKSAFRPGQYVGYGGGHVWRIRRSNSSYGNWWAQSQSDPNRQLRAWRLEELSAELSALNKSWWVHPGHPRGTICVLRESDWSTVALAVPQHSYREYSGCFSLL